MTPIFMYRDIYMALQGFKKKYPCIAVPEMRSGRSAVSMLPVEMMSAFPRTPSTVLHDPTAHLLREAGSSLLLFSIRDCPTCKAPDHKLIS